MAEVQDPREIGTSGLSGLRFNPDGATYDFTGRVPKLNNLQNRFNIPAIEDVGKPGAGDSRLDRKRPLNLEEYENLENFRGEEQSSFWQVVNGLAKAGVLTATTFLDGTVGTLVGLANIMAGGNFWDNPFSQAMKAANELSERLLPNYYTDDERENPFALRNIFSANFLGDKLIKNMGFTVGAFYSGNLWAKPLTAIKALKGSGIMAHIASGAGAAISAINEASIEAINNSNDWFNLQKAQLDDQYSKEWETIQMYRDTNNYDTMLLNLQNNYRNKLSDFEEKKLQVGNTDFVLNLPILLTSNLVEFGKLYARGFNTAQKAGRIVGKPGEYTNGMFKAVGRTAASLKTNISEGVEEVLQQLASDFSGELQLPPREYTLSMNQALMDADANERTVDWVKAAATAINKTFNEDWQTTAEQFLIGALTGALGMPTFGRANNADAWLGKNKIIGLSGGAVGAVRDYNQKFKDTQELVDQMNERVKSDKFKTYYQGLVKHNKFQDDMDAATVEGKAKEFKDAEYAQMIADIDLFARAGKLDDYEALIDEALDTSDENLASIVQNTTKPDGTGPFTDALGNPDISTADGKQTMIKALESRVAEMKDAVKAYRKENEKLISKFGNTLTDEQREELVWLSLLSKNQRKRSIDLVKTDVKPILERLSEILETEIENTKDDDKGLQTLKDNKSYVDGLISSKDETIAAHLAGNEVLVQKLIETKLADILANGIDSTVDIIQEIQDAANLYKDSTKYATKLSEYLENPVKITEENEKTAKKEAKKTEAKARAKENSKLNSSRTFEEIRENIRASKQPEVSEKALEESKNPIVQEYKRFRDKVRGTEVHLPKVTQDKQAILDATKMLDALVENAETELDFDLTSEFFVDPKYIDDIEGETSDDKLQRVENARNAIAEALTSLNESLKTSPDLGNIQGPEEGEEVGTEVDFFEDDTPNVPAVNPEEQKEPYVAPSSSSIAVEVDDTPLGLTFKAKEDIFESPQPPKESTKKDVKVEEKGDSAETNTSPNTWKPAVPQYPFKELDNGSRGQHTNEEARLVVDYISGAITAEGTTRPNGWEYMASGKFADYVAKGGKLYFGIDPNFEAKRPAGSKEVIFIYAKEGDQYVAIGSLYVSPTSEGKYTGQVEFNAALREAYANREDKDSLFISEYVADIKVSQIKRGRLPYSNIKYLADAIQNTKTKITPRFVVITKDGLTNATDLNTVEPEHMSDKLGNVYMEIPNAKRGLPGGTSLVYILPAIVRQNMMNDTEDSENVVGHGVNSSISSIALGALNGDKDLLKNAVENLSNYLLIHDIKFVLSKDGTKLLISKVNRDEKGNKIYQTVGDKSLVSDKIIANIPLLNSDSSQVSSDDVVKQIFDTLEKAKIRIRINKNFLNPEDSSYEENLIKHNLVGTYYDNFDIDSCWFIFDGNTIHKEGEEIKSEPIATEPTKSVTTESNEIKTERAKGALSKLRKGKIKPANEDKDTVSREDIEKRSGPAQTNPTPLRDRLTDEQRNTILKDHTEQWLNNATDDEIENALGCEGL